MKGIPPKHELKAGGYRNAAEVVREAMRLLEPQDELPSAALEAELIKGLESGPARPFAPGCFDKLRKNAAARLQKTRRVKPFIRRQEVSR